MISESLDSTEDPNRGSMAVAFGANRGLANEVFESVENIHSRTGLSGQNWE